MYEVKLEIRATRQVEKLDPHIKEVVKRRLREALAPDPHRYSFLSGKYSGLRRVAFSIPQQENSEQFLVSEKIKEELLLFLWDPERTFIKSFKDT
ncbi:MAG: type II toxin-antitoxin system RelE/ParE family toxin [bacterium]